MINTYKHYNVEREIKSTDPSYVCLVLEEHEEHMKRKHEWTPISFTIDYTFASVVTQMRREFQKAKGDIRNVNGKTICFYSIRSDSNGSKQITMESSPNIGWFNCQALADARRKYEENPNNPDTVSQGGFQVQCVAQIKVDPKIVFPLLNASTTFTYHESDLYEMPILSESELENSPFWSRTIEGQIGILKSEIGDITRCSVLLISVFGKTNPGCYMEVSRNAYMMYKIGHPECTVFGLDGNTPFKKKHAAEMMKRIDDHNILTVYYRTGDPYMDDLFKDWHRFDGKMDIIDGWKTVFRHPKDSFVRVVSIDNGDIKAIRLVADDDDKKNPEELIVEPYNPTLRALHHHHSNNKNNRNGIRIQGKKPNAGVPSPEKSEDELDREFLESVENLSIQSRKPGTGLLERHRYMHIGNGKQIMGKEEKEEEENKKFFEEIERISSRSKGVERIRQEEQDEKFLEATDRLSVESKKSTEYSSKLAPRHYMHIQGKNNQGLKQNGYDSYYDSQKEFSEENDQNLNALEEILQSKRFDESDMELVDILEEQVKSYDGNRDALIRNALPGDIDALKHRVLELCNLIHKKAATKKKEKSSGKEEKKDTLKLSKRDRNALARKKRSEEDEKYYQEYFAKKDEMNSIPVDDWYLVLYRLRRNRLAKGKKLLELYEKYFRENIDIAEKEKKKSDWEPTDDEENSEEEDDDEDETVGEALTRKLSADTKAYREILNQIRDLAIKASQDGVRPPELSLGMDKRLDALYFLAQKIQSISKDDILYNQIHALWNEYTTTFKRFQEWVKMYEKFRDGELSASDVIQSYRSESEPSDLRFEVPDYGNGDVDDKEKSLKRVVEKLLRVNTMIKETKNDDDIPAEHFLDIATECYSVGKTIVNSIPKNDKFYNEAGTLFDKLEEEYFLVLIKLRPLLDAKKKKERTEMNKPKDDDDNNPSKIKKINTKRQCVEVQQEVADEKEKDIDARLKELRMKYDKNVIKKESRGSIPPSIPMMMTEPQQDIVEDVSSTSIEGSKNIKELVKEMVEDDEVDDPVDVVELDV